MYQYFYDILTKYYFEISRTIFEILILYFYIILRTKKKHNDLVLSDSMMDKLIDEFQPEPIVPNIYYKSVNFSLNNEKTKNFVDYDLYDIKNKFKNEMKETILKYGIGTCGPPGFYGTLDLHLDLESKISEKLGMESSIIYSNYFTCVNSVISCFCRSNDVIFYHKDCNEAILRGILVTKSNSIQFTNFDDLKNSLQENYNEDNRNFVIAEGLFRNSGKIFNIQDLLELQEDFPFRIILDESLSFPLLGTRGISSFFHTDISKIDLIIGSFSHIFCSNGSFVSGSKTAVDYQRLLAPGYCFSASLPGFLSRFVLEALKIDYSKYNFDELIKYFHHNFNVKDYQILSDIKSPLIFISRKVSVVSTNDLSQKEEIKKLEYTKFKLMNKNIVIGLHQNPTPRLRICLKYNHTKKDIALLLSKLQYYLNKTE